MRKDMHSCGAIAFERNNNNDTSNNKKRVNDLPEDILTRISANGYESWRPQNATHKMHVYSLTHVNVMSCTRISDSRVILGFIVHLFDVNIQ